MRRLRKLRALERVHHADARAVDQLAARDHHAAADDRRRRAARVVHVRKRCAHGDDVIRDPVQPQGQLGDHAERALGADEEVREVVPGRGLDGPGARANHRAVGEDDLEREHVLAHRAVTDRRRAARVRGGHASERRIGAGIDGEVEAVLAGRGVER